MSASHVKSAIYLRISLDRNGDGLAVDRQRTECLRVLSERGFTLYETYEDSSKSAFQKNVKRPAYDRMVADYERGLFNAIICYDLDRLTRQPRQLEDWIDAAEGTGLTLVTANGEADLSTDNGRMFARIKATVARAEMERKSARQKTKNAQNVALGRPVPGKRRYGFEPGNMVERPDEAEQVRRLYREVLEGVSIFKLAQSLDRPPVRIREILTNPGYAGWVHRKGEKFEAAPEVARIVERETWESVQVLLTDPSRKVSPGNTIKFLASGIAGCGVCGARMVKQGPNYLCKGNLGHPTIKREILDEVLRDAALTSVVAGERNTPKEVTGLAQNLKALQDKRSSWQEQATWPGADLTRIRTEVAKLGKEIEAVSAALAQTRTTAVGQDIRTALLSDMTDQEGADWWAQTWETLPLETQRDLIRGLDIRVHNGRGPERVEISGS